MSTNPAFSINGTTYGEIYQDLADTLAKRYGPSVAEFILTQALYQVCGVDSKGQTVTLRTDKGEALSCSLALSLNEVWYRDLMKSIGR